MTWFITVFAFLFIAWGWVALVGPPYIPVLRKDLRQAFDSLYKVSSKDVLLDLGSGDGTVLREAARRGAKAIGFEINPFLVLVSRFLGSGLDVETRVANAWTSRFPDDVTVVYVFADKRDAPKVSRIVQQEALRLDKDITVISYGFILPGLKKVSSMGAHHKFTASPKLLRSRSA
ncbi:class I SAM-dependent methyltransferase [Candidatus Nomurabacteria bacterium]|nr:class I SAM-dependent methyltransferase [Candidatus Nomurabacteria bacterium]